MQFISYDSDDSCENPVPARAVEKSRGIVSTTDKVQTPPSWTLYESSSDDDSDEENDNVQHTKPTEDSTKIKLLDAELLFATTSSKPKFLSRNIDEKFEVGAVKQHSYDKVESIASEPKSSSSSTSSAQRAPAKNVAAAKPIPSKTEPAISAADLALKKKLDDRETLKVRQHPPTVIIFSTHLCLPFLFLRCSLVAAVPFLYVVGPSEAATAGWAIRSWFRF